MDKLPATYKQPHYISNLNLEYIYHQTVIDSYEKVKESILNPIIHEQYREYMLYAFGIVIPIDG